MTNPGFDVQGINGPVTKLRRRLRQLNDEARDATAGRPPLTSLDVVWPPADVTELVALNRD